MSKLTRAQLLSQLEASHAAYQRLEAECIALRGAAPGITRAGVNVVAAATAHDNYLRVCAQARLMAQRTGRCVTVG